MKRIHSLKSSSVGIAEVQNLPMRKALMGKLDNVTTNQANSERTEQLSVWLRSHGCFYFKYPEFTNWLKAQDNSEFVNKTIYDSTTVDDFHHYAEEVIFDDGIMKSHFGWFEDLAATVFSYVNKMWDKYMQENAGKNKECVTPKSSHKSGTDIYEIAKDPLYQNADYYDNHTGYIYQTAAYNRAKRFGLPTPGISVINGTTGELLGYAKPFSE
jgi:hypothetical protein